MGKLRTAVLETSAATWCAVRAALVGSELWVACSGELLGEFSFTREVWTGTRLSKQDETKNK